jgi:diguanylate cyclase (GGDEF)-like protein/putative nucleotidyltransferase with HDIG domain
MKDWYKYINGKIKEYVLVTYIVACLIYGATFFMVVNMSLSSFNVFDLSVTLGCIGLVYFLISQYIDRILPNQKPNIITGLLFISNLLIISLVTYYSAFNNLNLKSLYFIPVMLAALSNHKEFRYAITSICAIAIFVVDYLNPNLLSTSTYVFDSNLILIGILFLANWLIGGLRDIDYETEQYLQTLANYDGLTGLVNHRYFQEKLDNEIQEASLNKQNFSLIIADLDYFKLYNDTYGHQSGDEVLRQVGQILKEETEEIGFAARYGGEEFAVVLPGFSKKEAVKVAQQLCQRISNFNFYGAETQPRGKLTISCGVATYPDSAVTKKELIRAADQALYQAKNLSKNNISLYFNILEEIEVTAIEEDIINSIKTLVSIINAKDRYTYGHSERVSLYAKKLAQHIGLDKKTIKNLAIAAFLHDIGKIEIQRELLNKTSPLTFEERNIFYHHPLWGAEIIRPIKAFQDISPIILHHHENYDGSGYPYQIKGTDIPIGARIIRIVDSFDAMTTDRPYRKGQTVEKTLKELAQFAGSYYDPVLVNHFIELCKEGSLFQSSA